MNKIFAEFASMTTITLIIVSLVSNSFFFPNNIIAKAEVTSPVLEWHLNVTGLIENPLNLSWSEITALPVTTVSAAIICVDFPDTIVMEGDWTGVKFKTLMEEAKPLENATKVAFYADDSYSTDLTFDTAMQDNIIIAYEKDGVALDNLRLVVPGKWGYKWIHHLARIELVDYDFLGYWEGFGYSDEADSIANAPTPNQASSTPPDFFVPPPLSTTNPSPSPKPYPTSGISPAPLIQSTPIPETTENAPITIEAIYALVASIIVISLSFTLIYARKKR